MQYTVTLNIYNGYFILQRIVISNNISFNIIYIHLRETKVKQVAVVLDCKFIYLLCLLYS